MDTSSVSGYLEDGFEGVSLEFSQFEQLPSRGFNLLTRAKRYGRWYLLKSLNDENKDKLVYQEMLHKEFDILMRLQHPGVVQAIGMEVVEPLGQCIVMEWIEGVTLKKWLEGSTTLDERLHVARQLLDATAHIHAHGIAHRDLKPSNIMVTTNGKNAKIIDFGLADTDVHAILKQPAGTEQYMAPEQASTNLPDVRNDIYSLGVVLRQMDLGRSFKPVITRCLLPINERYQSVEELKADLHRRESRRRIIGRGAVAVAIAALLVATTTVAAKFNQDEKVAPATMVLEDNQAREQVDSLRNALDSTSTQMEQSQLKQDSLRSHLSGLNDTISSLNASNNQLRNAQMQIEERERKVDAAISQGLKIIDTANAATHIKEHVDTLTNAEYLWMDWHFQTKCGENKIPEYMNSIRNSFSSKELAEIEYSLKEHCNNYENQMIAKLHKVKGFYLVVD